MYYKNLKISLESIAITILIFIAPFMRLVIFDRGIIFLSLFLVIPIYLIGIFKKLSTKLIKLDIFRFLIFIFILYLIFSRVYYYGADVTFFDFDEIKSLLVGLLLFTFIPNQKELNLYFIASVISAIIMVFLYILSSEYYLGGVRLYVFLNEVPLDPNMTAATFFLPVIYLISIASEKKNWFFKIATYALILLNIYYTILSGSRGGLFTILALIFGTLFFIYYKRNKILQFFIVSGIISIALILIALGLDSNLLLRFNLSFIIETGGSGRTEIWITQIEEFFKNTSIFNALFGYGQYSSIYYLEIAAHNILIEYLWEIGLIGLIYYLILVIYLIVKSLKNRSYKTFVLLMGVLMWSSTISTNNQVVYWVLLYICYSNLKVDTIINTKLIKEGA
ncbi:O-antigen ligase family protein [Acholeplasma equirhinis]|uniref:O-antigen ligase family protein n=1 Tax=Acholeplasma equirhinis TaxID=555393 RepID=UPI00197A6FC3|nr:O-antigen ligase family protein [Acholeplasma equirhinis]MBN3489974.1 O-antigen ligase family protein [Acholeplasma equirhinis]